MFIFNLSTVQLKVIIRNTRSDKNNKSTTYDRNKIKNIHKTNLKKDIEFKIDKDLLLTLCDQKVIACGCGFRDMTRKAMSYEDDNTLPIRWALPLKIATGFWEENGSCSRICFLIRFVNVQIEEISPVLNCTPAYLYRTVLETVQKEAQYKTWFYSFFTEK